MIDRMTAEVRAKLIELQGSRTDEEFAGLIGVTRSHWTHIRAGRRGLTYAITKRAVRVFPELYPLVMRDLTAEPVEATA